MSTQAPQQTERQFERAVVEYAQLNSWLVYHTFDARRSTAGFPDLVLARKGRVVIAELKTERGRLGRGQGAWLVALGGEPDGSFPDIAWVLMHETGRLPCPLVRCWRPSDWDEIEAVLR